MSQLLYRLGSGSARHPFRVFAIWLLAAVAVLGLEGAVGGETTDSFTIPGTESQRAFDLLEERFPAQTGATGQVVFAGDLSDPEARAAVGASVARLRDADHVVAVTDPFDPQGPTVSPDGRIAFASVLYDEDLLEASAAEQADEAAEIARDAGLQAEVTGSIANSGGTEPEGQEAIGLAVAVVVLLVAFGSVIAMGIPIGTALLGIVVGMGAIGLMAGFVDVPSVSPMLATMIGLGVGIDYALFVVTRHRQHLHEGMSVADAAGRATATAGQAVLFAGMTVVIAISGLQLAGLPAVAIMGYAAAVVVAISMVAAVTLLPAFLGVAGTNIDRLRIPHRRSKDHRPASETASGRWAHHVGRHPWRYAVGSFTVLLALTAPILGLRIGFADDGTAAPSTTQRKAYDLLAEGFGPGFTGQLQVVVSVPETGDPAALLAAVGRTVAADPGVAEVAPPVLNPAGDTAVIAAVPTTSPQDEATTELVDRLRAEVLPAAVAGTGADVMLTGTTAALVDVSDRIMDRLPLFIGAVVLLSFLLLTVVFRSILVPIKAALMNLLSIGAAYGVVVAVFQWGWGAGLIGLESTIPVNPFVPMIMFAILFGLSMDYEVFLLSRVREEWLRHGDSHRSVVDGLTSTARVITSAALIMISVFLAFVIGDDPTMKMFGLGLASAVLVDATIVRMVLVPSTMSLLGGANWWLPGWLDRVLPHLDLESEDGLPEPAVAPDPSEDGVDVEPVLEPQAA